MKPLREFSTEQIKQLSSDEIIKFVVSEIKSSRATGADLEEEHVRLAPSAAARKEIRALWRDEKEWRAKPETEAKPKSVCLNGRRYSADAVEEHQRKQAAKADASFFGPTPQPTVNMTPKTQSAAKADEPTTEEALSKLVLALPAQLREDVFKALGLKRLTEVKDLGGVKVDGVKALTFQHSKTPTGIPGS